MLISYSHKKDIINPSRARIHVLPDKKDRIFQESQRDQFEASSQNYLESYDQVGRTGARSGSIKGALLCSTFGGALVAGATLLSAGSWPSAAIGAVLGTCIAGTLSAVMYPAVVSHGQGEAQSHFVKKHSAPYLEVGSRKWLTADNFLMNDINHQTQGRLPAYATA